ncbi:uncharacterized protein [Chanodichthys erythropterus]|uniref:uncharacterized protein n=1 Tax=Chanodichthys erythropterus TaxID=933992 RepID=UPI00351E1943
MAEARISVDQNVFTCPVCLDLLKDPVAIPCGHSYCKICITDCWDQEDEKRVYSCPQCRQTFSPRPALAKNTMLAEVVEKLKKTKLPADCYAGAGDVPCDVCPGRKYRAVKSCLLCLESFCQTHFDHHEEFHSRKPHKVIDATGRLQDMICRKHDKELEMFCVTDQQCICVLCKEYEHKNHNTESTEAQRTEKQKQLKETQMKIRQRIQQRQKDLQQLREAVESHKRSAQTAVKDSEKIFTELIRSIERSRSEVTQLIRDQEKAAVSRAEGRLERLEQEINDLRRRDAELEQLSHTHDHIHFLQSFQSLSAPPESTDEPDDPFSFLFSFDGMRESVRQLRDKLEDFCKEEIKKISDRVTNMNPKTRNDFLQYSHQLTLDLNTVFIKLRLTKKNRVITDTDTEQPYPDHPDRFDVYYQVLCRESVCGRCYWEIEWSGNYVFISVSYKSISRKGGGHECFFGHNDQSWSLHCTPSRYLFRHNNIETVLPVISCCRIGVFVDHSAGTLSFYSVSGDTMSLIHTVQTTFTQPLYPGFNVWSGSSVKLFFFVAKKDGGLRPCIDYRALNKITIKFRYPLPLVPAALEHLRGATVFTKLDLRSAPQPHPDTLAEHRHHVAEVLQRLRQFHLFLKAEKCSFHQPSVQFLGYVIDHSGIRMDEGKVSAIQSWPTPTTIKELQRFLGFSNFYRRFIKNYSTIVSPLTNLLRHQPKSLSWSPQATNAFETLKKAFTTAPLLVHPNPDLPFVVEVDASTTGVGAVLSQQQGTPTRWAMFFSRFNFSISYRPGSKNTKADALSRLYAPEEKPEKPDTILPESIFVNPIQWSEETIPSTNASTRTPPGCPQGLQYITRLLCVCVSLYSCSKMAEARISQDEFTCPVCLDLLKDPVAIPCGHSYCKICITDCWDQEDEKRVYSCPQCRQTFSPRPALAKNTMLAEVVEKLKKTKLPADCYAGAGDVPCDVCPGRKYRAVKSCLLCRESYCQTHFDHHEEFHSRKPHKVIDATARLQDMICRKHDKELEMFCVTDQQCICVLCKEYEHKNHNTESTEAQRTEKQKQLKETQMKIRQRIQQRQKDLQQLREAVESHKRSAQTAVKDSERIFTELIRSIERSRSEVTQLIRDQEEAAVSRAEGRLERLEQEINDLRRRDAELEQLSHTHDHIHFLQSFQSLSAPPESTDEPDDPFSSLFSFDGMRESVRQLRDKLEDFCKEEIKKISDRVTFTNMNPKTRKDFLQYSHQLTLDLNTVNKTLYLSEKNRVITFTYTVQLYPDHPDRFDGWSQVLCRESVCGRCYWEIDWSGNYVFISVSYKSISRKGGNIKSAFGFNDQSWSLDCTPSKYSFRHNNIETVLPIKSISHRIGVFVDHSAGTLSFYSVSGDTMSLIHSVQTTFTQPLYPGFNVWSGSSVKLC